MSRTLKEVEWLIDTRKDALYFRWPIVVRTDPTLFGLQIRSDPYGRMHVVGVPINLRAVQIIDVLKELCRATLADMIDPVFNSYQIVELEGRAKKTDGLVYAMSVVNIWALDVMHLVWPGEYGMLLAEYEASNEFLLCRAEQRALDTVDSALLIAEYRALLARHDVGDRDGLEAELGQCSSEFRRIVGKAQKHYESLPRLIVNRQYSNAQDKQYNISILVNGVAKMAHLLGIAVLPNLVFHRGVLAWQLFEELPIS